MNLARTLTGLSLVAAFAAGCVGAPDAAIDDGDEVSAEEVRSTSWERLVGAWEGTSGPFTGLVFTATPQGSGHHFFADVDTGIRCITTPCPSGARLDGSFTAGPLTITIRHPDRPSPEAAPFYGRYYYQLQGDTLTLSRSGRVYARLRKVVSYCNGDADDCGEQRLIVPRCLGRMTCTEENRCRYVCGRPTCATTTCGVGYFCQELDSGPTCLSNCARMRCAAGTTCRNTPTGASCVPNGPSCAAIRCASGYRCEETNGVGACVPAGARCGNSICSFGTVCCNPLRGICTPPGGVCIQ